MADLGFTDDEVERYSRHILLPKVGGAGQRKLMDSSAFVVGAGGLGSPALLYLAAAGVGRIGLADADEVELSNLQRQIIHETRDVGSPKVASAERAIRALNPDCKVEALGERLAAGNVREIVRGYDVVLDGSDNFPTRFLVADCCWFERIPLVSAAVLRFEGQLLTVLPREGNPCYRCFLPEPPPAGSTPSCQEAGVLGAVVGVMGTLQATEATMLLLGAGEHMGDRLLLYDALDCSFHSFARAKDPACPLCGEHPSITDLVEYDLSCEPVAGRAGGAEASCGGGGRTCD
ncbi:MAG: HesA/MoeB/ThiF family protein [Planctomycetota bacterium]|jgi:adenylyltransferase/sulfurtransferase